MKYFLFMIFFLFSATLCSAEFVTVTVHTGSLWNQPGGEFAYVTLKVPRHYPFSILESNADYLKVRDHAGHIGWISLDQVGSQKGVIVTTTTLNVRKGPGKKHPIQFKAFQGVTFKVLSEKEGWLQIMHENGDRGWVVKSATWGQ